MIGISSSFRTAAAISFASASAMIFNLGAARATELNYNFSDTSAVTGSAFVDPTMGSTDSASYRLTTTAGGKASVFLFLPGGAQLGTLGDLNTVSFDYKVNVNGTPVASSAPAIRFFTSNSFTEALVWENAYQAVQTNDTNWHSVSILPQNLWQRANGHNFDQISNLNDKTGFQGGFTPVDGAFTGNALNASTPIYGLQLTFGSGVAGLFDGSADNVSVNFNSATYTSNPVPEPASIALLAIGSVGLLARRRRQRAR